MNLRIDLFVIPSANPYTGSFEGISDWLRSSTTYSGRAIWVSSPNFSILPDTILVLPTGNRRSRCPVLDPKYTSTKLDPASTT